MRAWGESTRRNPGRRDAGWGSRLCSVFTGLTGDGTGKWGVCERHVRTVNLLRENHFLPHLHPIISVTFRNPQNPTVMPTSCGGCSDMQGWESKPDLKYFFLLRTTTSMSFSLCVYIMNTCLSVASFFFFFAPTSHIQIDLVVVNSKQLRQGEEALMMSPGIC